MKEIEEIWIIDNQGICMFNYYNEKPFIENIFGQLMSSMNEFSKSFSSGGIQSLSFGNHVIGMQKVPNYDLYIVIRAPSKTKSRQISKILNKINKRFIEKYSNLELDFIRLNPSVLDDFSDEISMYFDNSSKEEINEKWDGFDDIEDNGNIEERTLTADPEFFDNMDEINKDLDVSEVINRDNSDLFVNKSKSLKQADKFEDLKEYPTKLDMEDISDFDDWDENFSIGSKKTSKK